MLFSHTSRVVILIVSLSLFISGCSISWSFGKSSDSLSSSSESSSGEGDKETKPSDTSSLYMEDIMAATVLYVSQNKDKTEFQDNISSIAKSHGISDWENDKTTYTAMGEGLKIAGVSEENINELAYFKSLPSQDNYQLVLEGYKN